MKTLRVDSIRPNPDQPRKKFAADAMAELAKSIKLNGLVQPIMVRWTPSHWQIVAGERRWRAHKLAGIDRINVVIVDVDTAKRDILAIVENLQRADITPLEEARAFQRVLDTGMSAEDLAERLGLKSVSRVTDRTALLNMKPEYIDLMEKGHLSLSQANELSRLDPHGQDKLFVLIRDGRCETGAKLRAAAAAIAGDAAQGGFFAEGKKTSAAEQAALTSFENKMQKIIELVVSGFKDGEIVVLKKINPHRAEIVAGQIALICKHLRMMEREILQAAAQSEIVIESL